MHKIQDTWNISQGSVETRLKSCEIFTEKLHNKNIDMTLLFGWQEQQTAIKILWYLSSKVLSINNCMKKDEQNLDNPLFLRYICLKNQTHKLAAGTCNRFAGTQLDL